jgi:carboxymethylenebutenolidase
MCSGYDAHPPPLPDDLRIARIAGGAGAEIVELVSADGASFSAAVTEAPEPTSSGVVILPDRRGLGPFYIELAERFAQAGQHAIAIDFFGRTAGLLPRDDDFEFGPHLEATTVEDLHRDIAAALQALRARVSVDFIATVGFCFGGMHSFLAGADVELGLDAVVGFYGALNSPRFKIATPIDRAAEIRVPVLGIFGGADALIPTDVVREFEQRLFEAGGEREIVIYDEAPHSFFDCEYEQHAAACQDAWRRVLGFLWRTRERSPV